MTDLTSTILDLARLLADEHDRAEEEKQLRISTAQDLVASAKECDRLLAMHNRASDRAAEAEALLAREHQRADDATARAEQAERARDDLRAKIEAADERKAAELTEDNADLVRLRSERGAIVDSRAALRISVDNLTAGRDSWKARAEAAEQRVAELSKPADLWPTDLCYSCGRGITRAHGRARAEAAPVVEASDEEIARDLYATVERARRLLTGAATARPVVNGPGNVITDIDGPIVVPAAVLADESDPPPALVEMMRAARPVEDDHARYLGNLLARIHRDGGQYIEAVGLDRAVQDAEAWIVARLDGPVEADPERARLRDAVVEAARALRACRCMSCTGKETCATELEMWRSIEAYADHAPPPAPDTVEPPRYVVVLPHLGPVGVAPDQAEELAGLLVKEFKAENPGRVIDSVRRALASLPQPRTVTPDVLIAEYVDAFAATSGVLCDRWAEVSPDRREYAIATMRTVCERHIGATITGPVRS